MEKLYIDYNDKLKFVNIPSTLTGIIDMSKITTNVNIDGRFQCSCCHNKYRLFPISDFPENPFICCTCKMDVEGAKRCKEKYKSIDNTNHESYIINKIEYYRLKMQLLNRIKNNLQYSIIK